MPNDDLGTWLKVAAENKITTKNTWKSTLIDHFANVDRFRENHGINFQKASSTLDGCVKVYSTRVDDVSENALKLLEGFGEEFGRKKLEKKHNKSTIERNMCNLNIKPNGRKVSFDPKFLYLASLPENILLMSAMYISPDCMYRISSAGPENTVITTNIELSMTIPQGLLISPSLNGYREIEDMAMEPTIEDEMQVQDESVGFNDSFEFEDIPVVNDNQRPVFKETSFAYFKGWAGPSHWKIRSGKAAGVSRPKEKFFMDFSEPVDHDSIMALGNTLFEHSFIVKRRDDRHVLPQDFRLEIEDLYKYMVRDGLFSSATEEGAENMSIPLSLNSFVVEEPVDEFVADTPTQHGGPLLPFRRIPKKVDIKRLKENIFDSVKKAHRTNLTSLFREMPTFYDENEAKDISIHFCLVSLLHLANEKGIQLKHVGNNVEISLDT